MRILGISLFFSGAPARIRTADLLITNRESKFKKINTINVNCKLFQIWTHYEHTNKVLLTLMSILETIIIFEILYFAHHMLTQ